jgi:hypothetical protein
MSLIFKKSNAWDREKDKIFSVSEALSDVMDDYSYEHGIEGQISSVESNVNSMRGILTNLIQTLYDAGVIPEETIVDMVGWRFKKVDPNEPVCFAPEHIPSKRNRKKI